MIGLTHKASKDPRDKPRVFVVSPFVDKRHGTERRVAEWLEGLADEFEIHLYSQRVEDIPISKIVWHRIPALPGPHLLNYVWWFVANHACRSWSRRFGGLQPDIVFSPGINCLDADVVSVHVVFAEYQKRFEKELRLSKTPFSRWPRSIHRRLYYGLVSRIESHVYRRQETAILLIAKRTGIELERYFGRRGPFPVVYLGLDHELFNPSRRESLRQAARKELGYDGDRFVVLLIGNDWKNKGLPTLLAALALMNELPIEILAVGRENPEEYRELASRTDLEGRVKFRPPRKDVEFYYAAADAYVGVSIEDTFAQPPAEAMACGLPVIVSSANGTCEIIHDDVDGLILKDATDTRSLSELIRQLCKDAALRERLGTNAARTAREYTWERNARELREILREKVRGKRDSRQRLVEAG